MKQLLQVPVSFCFLPLCLHYPAQLSLLLKGLPWTCLCSGIFLPARFFLVTTFSSLEKLSFLTRSIRALFGDRAKVRDKERVYDWREVEADVHNGHWKHSLTRDRDCNTLILMTKCYCMVVHWP